MKNRLAWLLRLMCIAFSIWATLCQGATSNYMLPKHNEEVQTWLEKHKEYRLATIDDCNCMGSVLTLRKGDGQAWKPQPTYQPYYAVGDFNADGFKDFAVVVRPHAKEVGAMVLVFLGGQSKQMNSPIVFSLKDKTLEKIGLFLGRQNGKVARLLIGGFASEAEELRIPKLHPQGSVTK